MSKDRRYNVLQRNHKTNKDPQHYTENFKHHKPHKTIGCEEEFEHTKKVCRIRKLRRSDNRMLKSKKEQKQRSKQNTTIKDRATRPPLKTQFWTSQGGIYFTYSLVKIYLHLTFYEIMIAKHVWLLNSSNHNMKTTKLYKMFAKLVDVNNFETLAWWNSYLVE